jgi:hypothetical protein
MVVRGVYVFWLGVDVERERGHVLVEAVEREGSMGRK